MTMRKIVVGLVGLLTLTGVLLTAARIWELELPGNKLVSLGHIYGALFFMVIFPLYAWDHVTGNKRWLKRMRGVTVSGAVQLASALGLILSGVVILLYGGEVWPVMRGWHHLLTYVLAGSLALHFLSPKR